MHQTTDALLGVFREDPHKTLSTTELVQLVFPEQFAAIDAGIQSHDPVIVRNAKRKKARLHRRLMHHIGRLRKNGVLRVAAVQAHGEQLFSLGISGGEVTVHDRSGSVRISRHVQSPSFLDRFAQEKLVHAPRISVSSVEAYAVNCAKYRSLGALLQDLNAVLDSIDDVVVLANFPVLLARSPSQTIEQLVEFLTIANRSNTKVCLHLPLFSMHTISGMYQFLAELLQCASKGWEAVFVASHAVLREHRLHMARIVKLLHQFGQTFTIHHQGDPWIAGNRGVYRLLMDHLTSCGARGVPISVGSVCLDVPGFTRASQIVDAVRASIRTLAAHAATQQTRISSHLRSFSRFGDLNDQFCIAPVYVRTWGVDLADAPRELFTELKDTIHRICLHQSKIFTVAGLRFSLHGSFAGAFESYSEALSLRNRHRLPLRNGGSLRGQQLDYRQQVSRLFDCDRLRFFWSGPCDGDSALTLLMHAQRDYDLPLVSLSFAGSMQSQSLQRYLL